MQVSFVISRKYFSHAMLAVGVLSAH